MSTQETTQHETAPEDRIPISQKLGLAFGGFGVGGAMGMVSQTMTFILVFTLHLNPRNLSVALFPCSIIGFFVGPFIGQFCDNFRSRRGRRHSLIMMTAVPVVLLASMVYFIPSSLGETGKMLWVLVVWTPCTLLAGVYNTSLGALGVEATTDYHERTRLTRVLTAFGLICGVMLQWVFPFAKLPFFGGTMRGIHITVGTLTPIFLVMAFAPLLCPEKRYAAVAKKGSTGRLIPNMIEVSKNKHFLLIVVIRFLAFFCYNIVAGLNVYMNAYYMYGGNQDKAAVTYGWLGTSYCFAAIAAVIFLYPRITHTWGKKATLQIAASILIIDCLSKLFVYQHHVSPWWQLFVLMANGISVQGIYFATGTMMGDIIDYDELHSGKRREGLYGSITGWIEGIGTAIAGLLSGFILAWIGFNQKIDMQPERTLQLMKYAYFFFPMMGGLGALALSMRYGLSERHAYEIRDELKRRQLDEAAPLPHPPLTEEQLPA